MRTVFICINGILTDPRKDDAWTDEAVDWINRKLPDGVVGISYEYNATPLFRRWGQQERAQHIAAKASSYRRSGYRVVLIGHSNGCDLIARVIGGISVEVASVHLISPSADEADFERAIEAHTTDRIHIYGSKNDNALKFASFTRKWLGLGFIGLGYGSLGLRGQQFAKKYPEIVVDHSRDDFGHSDWFKPRSNFLQTMKLIVSQEGFETDQLSVTSTKQPVEVEP